MTETPKYFAFISYSHVDEAWGRWLHRAIEGYRVPVKLISHRDAAEPLPRRLYPVFRDRDELASAPELGREIQAALESSRNLIVVCSPASAASRWVDEEIRYFKRLGRAERVFCLIVDGEPGDPNHECFPSFIRYDLNDDGSLSDHPAEPIAADARPDGDGKQNALLKLIAGMLGVGFDQLKQRDLAARNRRLTVISAITVGVALVTLALAVTAQLARDAAVTAQALAEQKQAESEQVSKFLTDLFVAANPRDNRPDLQVREVLAIGAERVEQQLAEQPLVVARLQRTIGEAYWELALWEEGEARIQRALELMREHGDPIDVADVLTSYSLLLQSRERYDQALEYARAALDTYTEALGENSEPVAHLLIDIDRILGQQYHDTSMSRYESMERARRILNALGKGRSDEYGITLASTSAWHKLRFEWDQAVEIGEAAVALREATKIDEDVPLAFTIEDVARLYYFMGDYSRSRPLFERVIRIIETFKGPAHGDMDWSTYYLGRVERESGNRDRALALMERTVRQETTTPQTPDFRYLARALCGLSLVQADAGLLDEAQANCLRGREILDQVTESQQRIQHDVIHEGMAVVALARGDTKAAVRESEQLVAVRRMELDPAQTDTPAALAIHSAALAADGQLEPALAMFDEALALSAERYAADYPTVGRTRWARSGVLQRLGREAEAGADRLAAEAIFKTRGIVPQTAAWTMPAAGLIQ